LSIYISLIQSCSFLHSFLHHFHTSFSFFFFLMLRLPPRSTPFPTRRSSDLFSAIMSSSSVSPAKIAPAVPRIPARGLPVLLTFEGDGLARNMVSRIQGFRRASYDDVPEIPAEVDRILITSSERMLTDRWSELRLDRRAMRAT